MDKKASTHRFSKYTLISIAGLALDGSVVFLLGYSDLAFGWRATAGYFVALVATYLAHEYWTFNEQKTIKRASTFLLVTMMVGLLRGPLAAGSYALTGFESVGWSVAVGITFFLNYLLLTYFMQNKEKP